MGLLVKVMFFLSLIFFSSQALANINIPLSVKETRGINRTAEMVHNGIPLAKGENVTSTSGLLISDGIKSVPATFEVLARWGGGRDDLSKPIKWLLVSFPASVSANSSGKYFLRNYGTPAALANQVNLSDSETSITIDTGPAEFVISKTAMTLFDTIKVNGSTLAQGNGGSQSTFSGQELAFAEVPSVSIERQDGHYVCIRVIGTYGNSPEGTSNAQPLHYRIRYEFFAGSPTAIVTHKFFWPGYDGSPDSSGSRNVDNVTLQLPDLQGYVSSDAYATDSVFYTGISGEAVSLSQDRRPVFSDPHQATVSHGATSQTTPFAEIPAVINRAANGSLVATIGNMKFFEPQSIVSDASGKITVNVLDGYHEFAEAQGTWARVGIGALSSSASFEEIKAKVIAPVEHRLMALPDSSYLASSGVFDMLPNTTSSTTEVQAWWTELGQVIGTTETFLSDQKFEGLMTWGALPRYSAEIGSTTTWDKLYSGANLTDYHNACLQMTLYALLSQDPRKLEDYAFPAARRMLNTQIFQADDYVSPSSSYMGWAPAGYKRYRSDFNSSHSYFENLYAYYFLTGDMEVVDLLSVGAETRDGWYTRNGTSLDSSAGRPVNWISYNGRVFYQMVSIFDFLGHAGDAKFLEDWRHMYDHMTTSSLLLLDYVGREYGFIVDYNSSSPSSAEQSWMSGLYTLEGLYRLWLEYGDIQLGSNNLQISRVFSAIARGMYDFNRTAYAGAATDWNGDWSNGVDVTWEGDRIGGTLLSVAHRNSSDPKLYVDGKFNLATTLVRAGIISGDTSLKTQGLAGLSYLISTGSFETYSDAPLGKVMGIAFSRLADGLSYFPSLIPPKNLRIRSPRE